MPPSRDFFLFQFCLQEKSGFILETDGSWYFGQFNSECDKSQLQTRGTRAYRIHITSALTPAFHLFFTHSCQDTSHSIIQRFAFAFGRISYAAPYYQDKQSLCKGSRTALREPRTGRDTGNLLYLFSFFLQVSQPTHHTYSIVLLGPPSLTSTLPFSNQS